MADQSDQLVEPYTVMLSKRARKGLSSLVGNGGARPLRATKLAVMGFGAALVCLISSCGDDARRPDANDENAEFLKAGRREFALCVSDYSAPPPASDGDLKSNVLSAVDENKHTLWEGSFLEDETLTVDSPCPEGPTIDEDTAEISDYLGDIRIVEKPGPYILYVHVVQPTLLETLDRLNLGRIVPQEFIDPSPNQPAGYQQVATGLYLSAEEFEQPAFLARQIAEALGCTEGCAQPIPE